MGKEKIKINWQYLQTIRWHHVFGFAILHLATLYSILYTLSAKWQTWVAHWILARVTGFGVTAGAHRLWSHRSYKARLPLRIFFMLAQSMAFQHTIIEWAHLHRCHHKWSDTDADPYNPKRGFFFAHMGWELVEKHPDVISKGSTLDMADLNNDPVLKFQQRFWPVLGIFLSFIFPSIMGLLWGEDVWVSLFIVGILRYTFVLHVTYSVNSFAHKYGDRPYDKDIDPTDNKLISWISLGEGWHNYHHCFPSDYRNAELPYYFNVTTIILDMLSWVGLAHSMKTTPNNIIQSKQIRSGDLMGNDLNYDKK